MNERMKDTFKRVGELLGPIHNVKKNSSECTDEPIVLMTFSPPGEEIWVEILGHRFEGINGFEGMINYLNNYRTVEKELNEMINEKAALIDYVKTKLEEGKLMSTYENGIRYPSAQERIYEDILERIESGNYE